MPRSRCTLWQAQVWPGATVIVSGHETEWFSRLGARVLTLKEGRIA